jgi:C4-dicarboxylate-binding protein DctP
MFRTLFLTLLAAMAVCPGKAAAQAGPIVVRFSHVVAENTPKGLAARKFEELAERYTDGRVDVQVFPNSTLYQDRDELEALQFGGVEMLAPSLAKFGPLGISSFELFDLPFLFDDINEVHRLTQGEIGEELFETLRPRGIVGLAYWDNGFKIMSATRPLRLPRDFSGLPMRIQQSRVIAAQMTALGAVPRVMALSEVRAALETGWVDGTENPPSNMLTQAMYQVQPHATRSYHGYLGYAVIVNGAFWQALPETVREGLSRALDEATAYGNGIAAAKNAEALDEIVTAGTTEIHELTSDERAAWIAALLPVHEQMRDWIGADLVDEAHALLDGTTGPPT